MTPWVWGYPFPFRDNPPLDSELKAIRRRIEIWLDLEELTRGPLVRGGLVHFTKRDWMSLKYRHVHPKPSRDATERAFDRWKVKARGLGALVRPDPDLAYDLGVPKGDVYAIDPVHVAQGYEADANRLALLEEGYYGMLGRPRPRGKVPKRSYGPRDVPLSKVAKDLGKPYDRLRQWAKAGMPVDRRSPASGSRKHIFGNVEEIQDWIRQSTSEGRVYEGGEKVHVEVAVPRLLEIRKQLNLSTKKMADLIGIPKGRLGTYLRGLAKKKKGGLAYTLRYIPKRVMDAAEDLAATMRPLTTWEKHKRDSTPEADRIADAIRKASGNVSVAAEKLGMTEGGVSYAAKRLGIPVQGLPGISELISGQDIVDAMEASGHRVSKAAKVLGISGTHLSRMIEKLGLRDRFRIRVGRASMDRLTADEIREAVAAAGPQTMELAKLMGVDQSTMTRWIREAGLWDWFQGQRRKQDKLSASESSKKEREKLERETRSALKKAISKGVGLDFVAQELGIGRGNLRQRVVRYGLGDMLLELEATHVRRAIEDAIKRGDSKGELAKSMGIKFPAMRRRAELYGLKSLWDSLPVKRPGRRKNPGEIAIVGCSQQKLPHPAPAGELYTSQLFRLSRRYAESLGVPWFVISAQYALVDPRRVVEPYDLALRDVGPSGKARLAAHIDLQLRKLGVRKAVVLAGKAYRDLLPVWLEVADPLKGKGIGERKKWLRQNAFA